MNILLEDNHILALHKPAGISTQPSSRNASSLETQARLFLKEKHNKPGNVFLHPIHRLDKSASGVVLFAKNAKPLTRLQESMRKNQLIKIYYAMVEGIVQIEEHILENYLFHDHHISRVVDSNHLQAKKASLRFRVLHTYSSHTLLEIVLDTGRYHQIRVQLSNYGHPIVGDIKYNGKNCSFAHPSEIALHHRELIFPHPTIKDTVTVQSPLPDTELWNTLQKE